MENVKIDVNYIARLARLEITPEELPMFERDIKNIVSTFNALPEFENTKIEINKDNAMLLREDEISPSYKQDEILLNAPQKSGGCVIIPKVVD